jgi:cystathionine beta-synthase
MWYDSVIDLIGNTPLVKLKKVTAGIPGTILAKPEYFNPGHSVKDRIAIKLVLDAEKAGILKPGGTIVEGTSGNTGMGLALVAAQRGYKCVFTMADKQSKEKVDALRAVGAEVVVCPTNVEPSDPRSYYSTAKRIAAETPNSFYPNQYDNLSNFAAHYESTGPEIWNQTEGRVTHYVAGLGTGGTLCGTGKYLKEQNPNVQVIGIDTYGSVLKKYKETGIFDENEIYPYMVEGIGEDFIPKNIDFDVIDHIIKVTDKDSAIMARRLAREESLFIGWSCGAAVYGALEYARKHLKPDDIMVILLPDHGTRYLAKIYNDTWMKDHGFMENREFGTAKDIIQSRGSNSKITTVDKETTVQEVISIMAKEGISQIPVTDGEHYIGSLNESKVLYQLLDNPEIKKQPVKEIMEKPFKFVGMDYTIDALSSLIDKDNKAVLVRDEKNEVHIITQADLLAALAK